MLNRLFLFTLVILIAGCGKPSGGISGVWITENYSQVLILQKDGTYILSEAVDSEFAGGILYKSTQGKFKRDKSASGISLKIPSGTLVITESLSASGKTEYNFPSSGHNQPSLRLIALSSPSYSAIANYVKREGELFLSGQKKPLKLSVRANREDQFFAYMLKAKGKEDIQIAEVETPSGKNLLFLHQESEDAALLTVFSQSVTDQQSLAYLNNPLSEESNSDSGLRFTVGEEQNQYVISEASSF